MFDPNALNSGAPQGLTPPGGPAAAAPLPPGGNPNPMMDRADQLLKQGIISPEQHARIKAAVAGGPQQAQNGIKAPDIANAGKDVAGNMGAMAGNLVGRVGKGIGTALNSAQQPPQTPAQMPQSQVADQGQPITGPSPQWNM